MTKLTEREQRARRTVEEARRRAVASQTGEDLNHLAVAEENLVRVTRRAVRLGRCAMAMIYAGQVLVLYMALSFLNGPVTPFKYLCIVGLLIVVVDVFFRVSWGRWR